MKSPASKNTEFRPMAKKPNDDLYSPEEAKQRMMAALRGARVAGHVPMRTKKGREENQFEEDAGR
jgi:hypothetical protein